MPNACAGGSLLRLVMLVLLALPVAATADTASDSDPAAVVAALHQGLIDAGADPRRAGFDARYRLLEPLIKNTHDLPYIARFTLRRHWNNLADEQHELFVKAFAELSISTYASRFRGAGEGTFSIFGHSTTARGHVEITGALVRSGGEHLSISYILHESERGWLIINIVVDGVSDLALKRSEYQRIVMADGFEGLLNDLDAQVAELIAEFFVDTTL
jgi:phospholipid transport system substrate-binding protein